MHKCLGSSCTALHERSGQANRLSETSLIGSKQRSCSVCQIQMGSAARQPMTIFNFVGCSLAGFEAASAPGPPGPGPGQGPGSFRGPDAVPGPRPPPVTPPMGGGPPFSGPGVPPFPPGPPGPRPIPHMGAPGMGPPRGPPMFPGAPMGARLTVLALYISALAFEAPVMVDQCT